MLISTISSKVEPEAYGKWNESLNYITLPTWDNFVKLVERHCQYLESSQPSPETQLSNLRSHRARPQRHQANLSLSYTAQNCHLSAEHKILRCPQFINLSFEYAFNHTKWLGLCPNCLSKGHQVSNYPSAQRCRRWSRKLHTVLHRESTGPALTVAAASLLNPAYIPEAVFHSHQQQDHVILATALVLVKGASGCYRLWRAVLDSCSLINFITDEFAQTLHIPRAKKIIKIRSIVVSRTQEKHSTTTSIKYRLSDFELTLDFCVTPSIAHHPNTENTSLVLTYFLEQRPFLRFCRLGKSTYP